MSSDPGKYKYATSTIRIKQNRLDPTPIKYVQRNIWPFQRYPSINSTTLPSKLVTLAHYHSTPFPPPPPPLKRMTSHHLRHILRHKLMHMTRRIQILHPIPLILFTLRHTHIPIILQPRRHHRRRPIRITITKRRISIRILLVREFGAGIRIQIRHEGVGIVVEYLVSELLQFGRQSEIGFVYGGAESGPFGGRGHVVVFWRYGR